MSDLAIREFNAEVFINYYPRGEKQTFIITAKTAREALEILLAQCPNIRQCEVILQHELSGEDWVYAHHGFFDGTISINLA